MKAISLFVILTILICVAPVLAEEAVVTVSSSPGAEGTWTDSISPSYRNDDDFMNISISGTWDGTVTLQRSFDGEQNWYDVGDVFLGNAEKQLYDHDTNPVYRLGVKNGDYTSGSIVLRLSK